MTPLQAIRQKCLDCCCGQSSEVKNCTVSGCSLYPFRLGRKPKVERYYTPEQIEQRLARLRVKQP